MRQFRLTTETAWSTSKQEIAAAEFQKQNRTHLSKTAGVRSAYRTLMPWIRQGTWTVFCLRDKNSSAAFPGGRPGLNPIAGEEDLGFRENIEGSPRLPENRLNLKFIAAS